MSGEAGTGAKLVKAYVLGIILTIIVTMVNSFAWILAPGADFPISILAPILILFILRIVSDIGAKLSKESMAIIYSMILISIGWSFISAFWISQASGSVYVPRLRAIVSQWIPDLWTPRSILILKGMFLGGSIPWGAWMTPVLFWIALALAWAFLLLSLMPLFSTIFVDIERLSFPLSTIPLAIIGKSSSSKFSEYFRDILFIGGLLIAIAFTLPDVINTAVKNPNFLPSPAALMTVDWHEVFPEIKYVLRGAVLYTSITPLMFAFAYLLPLDVLLTQWITYIFFMIVLPVVDIYMLHPERFREYVNSPGYAWDMTISPAYSVWRTEALTLIGGIYGLALFYIAYNWSNISSWIKKLFRERPKVEMLSGVYFVFSAVILIALLTISGMPLVLSILLLVMLIVSSIGMTALRASAGGNILNGLVIGGESNRLFTLAFLYDTGGALGIFNSRPSPTPTQQCFLSMQAAIIINGDAMAWNPLALGLESYKICSEYGIGKDKVFTAQALALLVAILVSFPLVLSVFYNYGIENIIYTYHSSIRDIFAEAFTRDLTLYYTNVGPLNVQLSSPYLPHTIAGIIIVIALMYMRIMKPGFPLNPAGYVLGASFFTYPWWTAFLVAWIVKYIIIRIGGAELYERTIKFSTGIAIGTGIGFLMLWLASLMT